MAFIKNIDHETVLNLADQIHAEPGSQQDSRPEQGGQPDIIRVLQRRGDQHPRFHRRCHGTCDRWRRSVYRRRCRAYLQSRRCSRNAGEEAACGIREGRF